MDYIELIYIGSDDHKLTYGVIYKCQFINFTGSYSVVIKNDDEHFSTIYPIDKFITLEEMRDRQINKILE
jgi:hypothetical protein